jgi:predicted NBD/HSP70 family sugar kinase
VSRTVQPTSGALRAVNRARIVTELRRHGSATRAELGRRTGLSRATVSSLVGELLQAGLVSERREPSGASGRPAAELVFDRSAGVAIAVDVGVRHVAVAVGDLSRSVIAERWIVLPRGHRAETGTATVLDGIAATLAESGVDDDQIVGAAISLAAPIARDSGRLLVPGVLPGWNGTELASIVGDRWRIPVALDNDANLGALGETVSRGAGDDTAVLYVKLASRIGLGIALGSRIYRGRDGYAGELGHMTVHSDGDECWCGRRGCLELYAGGDGILRKLGPHAPATVGELIVRARAGDGGVLPVIADAAQLLASALSGVALLINPSAILIGGEFAALGELVVGPVRRAFDTVPFGAPAEVAVSPLGERASLVGALALVLSESAHFVDRSAPLVRPRADEDRADASPWGRGAHLVTQ